MGYEDSVYLAKLAEQAERYEGTLEWLLQDERLRLMPAQRWSRT